MAHSRPPLVELRVVFGPGQSAIKVPTNGGQSLHDFTDECMQKLYPVILKEFADNFDGNEYETRTQCDHVLMRDPVRSPPA